MSIIRKVPITLLLFLAVAAFSFGGTEAQAYPSYFSANCTTCHVNTTCNGCHHHGPVGLKGATDKTTYAPGETVSVTITGGSQSGWFRAILYDQNNQQVAISSGNDSGMGHTTTYPAVLSAPAPTTPGTYTWKAAWFGNSFDSNNLNAGSHGEVAVNTNSFTVAAPADTTAPVVGTFTLPATASSLTVPVSALSASDNVGVTGYLVTTSAATPAAGVAGWSANAPSSVTAPGTGSVTFYAWARDAAGNVSNSRSATVKVTLATASDPVLTVSTLADGAYTNQATLNVSGSAVDPDGIQSVTVNGQAVTVNADGTFSVALALVAGSNPIIVVATDTVGSQSTDSRTVTYDPTAPVITVTGPADNSSTTEAFVIVSGTLNEAGTVSVKVNNEAPQAANLVNNGFSATVYLAPGVNTIEIDATDLAGNTANAKRTVTWEAAQITLAVTDPAQDITTGNATLLLKGTVSDLAGDAVITITMDGQTYTPAVQEGAFQQELTFSAAGQYAIAVTATDGAGNTSTVYRNVIYQPAGSDDEHPEHDRHGDRHHRDDDHRGDHRDDRSSARSRSYHD